MNRAVKVVGVGGVLIAVFLSGVAVERTRERRRHRQLIQRFSLFTDEQFERLHGRPVYPARPTPQDMPIDLRPHFTVQPLVPQGSFIAPQQ
jgi:hypothetical protein